MLVCICLVVVVVVVLSFFLLFLLFLYGGFCGVCFGFCFIAGFLVVVVVGFFWGGCVGLFFSFFFFLFFFGVGIVFSILRQLCEAIIISSVSLTNKQKNATKKLPIHWLSFPLVNPRLR